MGYVPVSGGPQKPGGYVPVNPQPAPPDPRIAEAVAAGQKLESGGFLSSLGEGIGNAISGVPRAAVSIGEEAGKIARLPTTAIDNVLFRRNADQINNNWLERNLTLPEITPTEGDPRTLNQALSKGEQALPVAEAIARGFGQTVGELDPRDSFANLRRNYSNDPVGSALNDAVNVATVASAGAGAAGKVADLTDAAGATKTAATLGKVADVANKVAAAPFLPYKLLAKAPGVIGEYAYNASQDALRAGEVPTKFQTVAAKLARVPKQVDQEIFNMKSAESVAGDKSRQTAINLTKLIPDKTEQAALFPVVEGTANIYAKVRDAIPADNFTQYAQDVADRSNGTLTPEAVSLAADVASGKAPDLAARIQQVVDSRKPAQAEYLAAHPEQAGYDPNQYEVGKAVKDASVGLSDAQAKAQALRAKADAAANFSTEDPVEQGVMQERAASADRAATNAERQVANQQAAVDRAQATASRAIENAPSKWKPILGESRATVQHLTGVVNDLRAQGIPDAAAQVEKAIDEVSKTTTLPGIQDSGATTDYLPHRQDTRSVKGGNPRPNPALPTEITAGSERLRAGSPEYERTAKAIADSERENAVAQARRASAAKIAAIPGAVEHLGEGPLALARTAQDAWDAGYVPWNPKTLFDTQGRVAPLDNLDAVLGVEHPTMFMPRTLFNEYRNYFEPARGQVLGLALDPANRLTYMGRLAFSPSYIIGRIGHAVLAPMGTSGSIGDLGRNLLDVAKSIRASNTEGSFLGGVRNAMNGEGFPSEVDPRVLKSGANTAEYTRLVGDRTSSGVVNKINAGLQKVSGPSFRLAGMLDNMSRAAFYMTELGKKGNAEAALTSTLRFMGEFDKATPFERDYMRRVVPMYAWHREISKIASHLAQDHPLRVAWMLHLGNSLGAPDSALPSIVDQTIPLPGGLQADAGVLNPFSEVGSIAKGVIPFAPKLALPLKMGLQSAFSENLTTGKPFSTGVYGAPAAAPPLWQQFAQDFPQTRLLRGLTGASDNAQTSDWQDIKVAKPMSPQERADYIKQWHIDNPGKGRKVVFPKEVLPSSSGGPLTAISSFLGVPLYSSDALAAQAQDTLNRNAAKLAPKSLPKKGTSKGGYVRPGG